MLHWLYFLCFLIILTLISISAITNTLFNLILQSEILLTLLIGIMILITLITNIYWSIVFGLCLLILGGLELALKFLLLTI